MTPPGQGIRAGAVLRALLTHAKLQGCYDVARIVEPKAAPPPKLCLWLWANTLGAALTGSGLSTVTADLLVTARITHPAITRPEDDGEIKVIDAADGYLARLAGDLTLGGLVRNVDLLGEMGEPMTWRFGYIGFGDTVYRTADLQIPCVINDAWSQAE